jgi:hypothetical protein
MQVGRIPAESGSLMDVKAGGRLALHENRHRGGRWGLDRNEFGRQWRGGLGLLNVLC